MRSMEGVATFVGIDAHATRCSIKALAENAVEVITVDVRTAEAELRDALAGLPRPVWAMLEASTMAPFVRECLGGVVDRVIVCETRENRWVAKSEDKSDPADADRLARLLRLGEYKEVHVPTRERQELRELVILARKAVGDVTRAKNRIKSKYRQHGVPVSGSGVFSATGRSQWLREAKSRAVRSMLAVLYDSLDSAEACKKRVTSLLLQRVRRTPVYKRLLTVPGFGPVVCPIFIAVIDDPWRFPDKRHLWSYAGLGVRRRSSGSAKPVQEGGSRGGNRLLKYAAMLAAHTAMKGDNRFARHAREMIASGVEKAMAMRTSARNILAAALAIWKNSTVYHDDL